MSLQLMATGAAPLPSKVGDFMRTVFGANFVEGYGQLKQHNRRSGHCSAEISVSCTGFDSLTFAF